MAVTLKDIAKETGLSVTTISLVLNDRPGTIPKRTQDRVREAAQRLNYRPNQLAVGLVKRRTKIVGLLVQDISNSYYAALAKGVEEACGDEGWSVMLCNMGDKHERALEYIKVLESKGVDGFIISRTSDSSYEKDKEIKGLLKKLDLPYLILEEETPYGHVTVDNTTGGFLAMEHLIKLGHRKLGCISSPLYMTGAKTRLDGAKKAMEQYGLDPDDLVLYEGNHMMDGGGNGIERMLQEGVTGVFAGNDMMALGAYKACVQRGISIPGDVSLVGFDDIYFADVLEKPLTTVHLDNEAIGRELGKTLIAALKKEPVSEPTVFTPNLVIRGTTAKPKK